jgi:hypothetical protein
MSYYYYYYEHVLSCLIVLLCGPFLSVLSLLSDAKMCGQKREGICHLTIFVHTGRIYIVLRSTVLKFVLHALKNEIQNPKIVEIHDGKSTLLCL